MQIDWSINPVGVGQILVFICGGLWVLFGVRAAVSNLQTDVAEMKVDMKALTTAVGVVPVVETKFDALKERFEDDRRTLKEFREWFAGEVERMWASIRLAHKTVTPL